MEPIVEMDYLLKLHQSYTELCKLGKRKLADRVDVQLKQRYCKLTPEEKEEFWKSIAEMKR